MRFRVDLNAGKVIKNFGNCTYFKMIFVTHRKDQKRYVRIMNI